MRPLSQDLRLRIVRAREKGEGVGEVCQRFGVRGRDQVVGLAGGNQDRHAGEIRQNGGLDNGARPEETRAGNRAGIEEHRCGRHIGAIRITERVKAPRVDGIFPHHALNPIRQFGDALADFIRVKAFGPRIGEKSPGTVLHHISARTQDCGPGRKRTGNGQQVVFISTRAVEEKESYGRTAGYEFVNEIHVNDIFRAGC